MRTGSARRALRIPSVAVSAAVGVLAGAGPAGAVNPNDFAPSPGAKWHDSFCTGGRETVLAGDFNGDRRTDLVAFDGDHVWVLFASPSAPRFEGPVDWNRHPLPPGAIPVAGDVDGDGTDDLVYFLRNSVEGDAAGDVWAVFTDRNGFNTRVRLHDWFCVAGEIPALGDTDRDQKADLLSFVPGGEGQVWVGRSAGRAPVTDVRPWTTGFLGAGAIPLAADFDGDRRADIAAVVRESDPAARGHVYVALAQDDGRFGPKTLWSDYFCIGEERPFAGDVDGDGRADLLTFVRGRPVASRGTDDPAGDVYTALSVPATNGHGRVFGPGVLRHPYFCIGAEVPLVGDFDGDRKVDLCTLVRATVAANSSLFGDVNVARSTFGTPSSWLARLEGVKIERATESGGDDPYFVLFAFRVRANEPGSAQVSMANFRAAEWPEDLARGATAAIPEAMGSLLLPAVGALTLNDLESGRMPELVGFRILCCESDNSSWDTMLNAMNEIRQKMQDRLKQGTEWRPIRPASRMADLQDWLEQTAGDVGTAKADMMRVDLGPIQNDAIYRSIGLSYLTVDPEVLPRLKLSEVAEEFGTRTLTEQHWRINHRPLTVDCHGEGQWKLQFRLQRQDAPAP